jgi:ATP-binding cassette, subfamily C, bacterial exporter for protease/lipase
MSTRLKLPDNEIGLALKSFQKTFRSVAVFSAVINLLLLTPSLYMLQVYDRVMASKNETTLLMLTMLVVLAYLLMNGLELIRSYILIRIGAQLDMDLNRRIYQASFEQNLKNKNANAGQALQDLTTMRQFLTGPGLFAFLDAPWLPVYLIASFMLDWLLGAFSLAGTIILIALAWANETISRKPLAEANTMAVTAGTLATNNLRNAEVIQAMGMLPNLMARWFRLHARFLQLQGEASEKAGFVNATSKFVRLSLQSMVLGLGALLALENRITPGMMIVASVLMGRALAPVDQLISVWKNWSATRSAYERLAALLEGNPLRAKSMALPKPQGHLSLENVTAVPPGSNSIALHNITMSLPGGEVLGVVGPSGSGKSTLARLLVGVWPAVAGKVRLDGSDVYLWDKSELGPHIGYLPQDIELFSGTVAENIARFGEVDSENVIRAATSAGIHHLILRLPLGYDTNLGDGGTGLSGGQKQRIGLARALYGTPSLVVLDEPNSNLDETGELALSSAINELKAHGKTVVVVSHRASAITTTTRLLVLREGKAQMYGPTQQVLAELKKTRQSVVQTARPNSTNSLPPQESAPSEPDEGLAARE